MTDEKAVALTGTRKTAILLIALGSKGSAEILKQLPQENSDRLAAAIARIEQVSEEQVDSVLNEYSQLLTSQRLLVRGGVDYARKLLVETYGADVAQQLIARLTKSLNTGLAVFDNFSKVDPQQLAKFIQDEHPQTIALVLSHLDAAHAASLFSALPPEIRKDIAVRIAELDEISPEIVRNIASVIEHKLRSLGEMSREQFGGVRALADMLNRLDPATGSKLLDSLELDHQPLFENIRRFMFVFKDLENLDTLSLKTLMGKVDRKILVVALKGANDSLRAKFLNSQSARAAEMMLDDIASLGPVKLKDVDTAQQQIIARARELEKEGTISLSAPGTDQYVT
ncbi:MAG TPA: flagellar motor switch protein FliG [Bryobacteraceae bacterium]|nr:flagellar motor switch protein FliG [Bryobacteraceae bacterium]